MSSKQLNFFITPEDHPRINEFLKKRNVLILLKQNISESLEAVSSEKLPTAEEFIFQTELSKEEFRNNIYILPMDTGRRYFDVLKSFLLEFSIGGFHPKTKNILDRARFYYIKSYWNKEEILEKKSEEFTKWSDGIIKEFKKEFLKRYPKEDTFWYSDSAIRWIEKNNAVLTNGGQQWEKKELTPPD